MSYRDSPVAASPVTPKKNYLHFELIDKLEQMIWYGLASLITSRKNSSTFLLQLGTDDKESYMVWNITWYRTV